jgi:hypothetical protein
VGQPLLRVGRQRGGRGGGVMLFSFFKGYLFLGRISILTSTLIYYTVCLSVLSEVGAQPRELAPL